MVSDQDASRLSTTNTHGSHDDGYVAVYSLAKDVSSLQSRYAIQIINDG